MQGIYCKTKKCQNEYKKNSRKGKYTSWGMGEMHASMNPGFLYR